MRTLEQRLGATLLRRTTRAVVLTDTGREYLAQITDVLARLDDAEHLARGDASLHGTVELAPPLSIATRLMIPTLPAFVRQHPDLRVDIAMADHRQEPVQEAIDVAISFRLAKDAPAKARRVATNERILVASTEYLQAAGIPTTPVQPRGEQRDKYLANATMLRPELAQVDGFVANIRYKSLTRDGWILSLSDWRDEKAVVGGEPQCSITKYLIDDTRPKEWSDTSSPADCAEWLGLDTHARDMVSWDVFEAVLTPATWS